ncbi:MAG: hypothetical protein R3B84_09435 [Zavarzinella sp.]
MTQAHQIAIVWQIDDVREVRPDLSNDQCWQVLQACKRNHDATVGINWDVIRITANHLFEPQSGE